MNNLSGSNIDQSKRFENKVAIVTGAGSGIGKATAHLLAAEGARVICSGRTLSSLNATVAEIKKNNGIAEAHVLDVTDEQAFAQLINSVVDSYKRIDVLVNNAAYVVNGMIDTQSADDWRENFSACMDSTFFGTKAVMPIMQKQQSGAIVNVSSVCGMVACMGTSAYSAAKSGVIAFTRNTAIEGAPYNIRANVVSPGIVMTPATEAAIPDKDAQDFTAQSVPLKRIADPFELAKPIVFLASEDASYITGVNIPVDGGRTCELVIGAADFS